MPLRLVLLHLVFLWLTPTGGPVRSVVTGLGPVADGLHSGGAGSDGPVVVEPTVGDCEGAELISLEPVTDNPGTSA